MNYQIDRELCVDCGACEDACPVCAIALEPYRHIDTSACVECGACADGCPVEAIKESMSGQINNLAESPRSGKSGLLLKCFSVNEDKIEGAELLSAEIGDDKWYGFSCVAKDDDGDFLKYSFYLLPEGEDCSSGLVFCYLGDCDGLSDFVHKINSDNIANCWKAWPLLMQAIKNGLEDNYSRDDAPALICYGTNKMWGMATRYENVDFEQLAAHLNDKRIDSNLAYLFKKAINATNYAMRMLVEVDENDISVMDGIVSGLKSLWNGYQTGRAIQNGLDFISKFL